MRLALSRGVVMVLTVAAASCLKKDTVSTWWIEADRRVVWTFEERDVRADESSKADADRLEDEFIAQARQSNHPVARALRQLTPTRVTSRLVREQPPFHVVTDAHFPGLAELGLRLLSRLGLRGTSFVEFTRDGFEWTWSIDADSRVEEDLLDEDFSSLFESSAIRIGLAEGRFLPSSTATLSDDQRFATFPIGDLVDGHGKDGMRTQFVLAWSAR